MDLGATKGTNFFLRKREIFERLQEKERNDLKDDENEEKMKKQQQANIFELSKMDSMEYIV